MNASEEALLTSSKERDAETGLDFLGARYLSSAQGRFTSADTPLIGEHPGNPQSWNLYSYGLNNPLRFTDPTGHFAFGVGNDCFFSWKDCALRGDAGPQIRAVILPQSHGPLDRPIGCVKKQPYDAINAMGGEYPSNEARWLMWQLMPSTEEEKKGVAAFDFAETAAVPFAVVDAIAGGHALVKHLREFADLGVKDKAGLAKIVDEVMHSGRIRNQVSAWRTNGLL
jgi:RHS repeat-associated protein